MVRVLVGTDGRVKQVDRISATTDAFYRATFDRALANGELQRARGLWHHLAPLTQALFDEPSPAPVKAVLAAMGACRDELRLPMTSASSALRERIVAMVEALPVHG